MTPTQLSDRSGVDRAYLYGIESGMRNFSMLTLEKIARALKVPPRSFFED